MKKHLSIVFALTTGLSLLSGCSSTQPLVEPYMAPMESDYSAHKNWQVKLESMPNRDTEGLFFAEDTSQLYIATESGHLAALKKENRSRWIDQVVWQVKFDSPIVSGPTRDNDRIFIGTSKGQLIAIAAESGAYLWQSQLSSEVISRAVIAERKIFTRTVDGKLYALSAKTGKVQWVTEHQMPSLSLRGAPEVVYANGKVFVGWESGIVQALSARSGALLWESRIAVPRGRTDLERIVDVQAKLVFKDDRLFVLGYHGKLASMNPDSGQFYFVKDVSGYRDFVVDDQRLYMVDEEDVLHAFDINSGVQTWKQAAFKNRLIGDLAESNSDILAVDSWGYLHWINKLQGIEIGRVKHSNEYGDGNRIARVYSEGSRLYLLDDEGVITSYDVAISDLKKFKLEHDEYTEKEVISDKEASEEKTDDAWWKFSLSDMWPFNKEKK